MRRWALVLVAGLAFAQSPAAQTPAAQSPVAQAPGAAPADPKPALAKAIRPLPVGTMSELMIRFLYPQADSVFYIETRTPTNDAEWAVVENNALTLAETANLLMMPGRARDEGKWMADAKILFDVGSTAFKAAKKRDVETLAGLNDQLYAACVTCHEDYRPNYGRGRLQQNTNQPGGAPAAPAAPTPVR